MCKDEKGLDLFSSMTPEGEAMYCAKLGLDNEVAKPMKVKRSMYD